MSWYHKSHVSSIYHSQIIEQMNVIVQYRKKLIIPVYRWGIFTMYNNTINRATSDKMVIISNQN